MTASERFKATVRHTGWVVIVLVIAALLFNLFGPHASPHANAAPVAHHHKYKAGCKDDVVRGWEASEGPKWAHLGTIEVHAWECWNSRGNITSHSWKVPIVLSKLALATNYALDYDSADLVQNGKWGFSYELQLHARECIGIWKICVPGNNERFNIELNFFSPAWVRHLNTEAPGARKIGIGDPFEAPLGQSGYGLHFKVLAADKL